MRNVVLAAAVASLPACTIAPSDESVTTQNAETHNRLASNRLASNRLASNRLASNRLASNSLSSTRLVALDETADLLSTPEGRDVYHYIISCALRSGMTIEAVVPGAEDTPPDSPYTCVDELCTFEGNIGLAPKWIDRRLTRNEGHWVSACLFSRVSAIDTAESISLRGRHEGLAVTPEEAELFTVEEGAFYGNLFTDDPEEALPDWYACRGIAKATGVSSSGLDGRLCTEEDPANPGFTYCGFYYAGDCADFTPQFPSPYACRTFNAGIYGDCHEDSGMGHWPSSKKYREVITVYVTN